MPVPAAPAGGSALTADSRRGGAEGCSPDGRRLAAARGASDRSSGFKDRRC